MAQKEGRGLRHIGKKCFYNPEITLYYLDLDSYKILIVIAKAVTNTKK